MVKLRELRKQRGFTQQQLADIVGVSNVSLSNYERGTQAPDIEILIKLADALGVSLDTLVGRMSDSKEEYPITKEAQIIARGVDKLPQGERIQALNVARAMFEQYSDYFDSRENADGT